MGFLDKPFAGLVSTLLKVLGGDATLIRRRTAYDPVAGNEVPQTHTYPVKISAPESQGVTAFTAEEPEVKVLLAAADAPPGFTVPYGFGEGETYLKIGASVYRVFPVEQVIAQDQSVAYLLWGQKQ